MAQNSKVLFIVIENHIRCSVQSRTRIQRQTALRNTCELSLEIVEMLCSWAVECETLSSIQLSRHESTSIGTAKTRH